MLRLNDEQRMVVNQLREIASEEFADRAFEWNGEFPWRNIELLADRGFMGLNLPTAYGGGGMTERVAMLAIETVGRVCPDTANALYGQTLVAPRAVDLFGSPAAKERYLPPVCAGESALAIGISEPQAGSDAGAMTTTVTDDGDRLTVSGEKIWVSYVRESDAAVIWARFPDGTLGSVIVDLDAAGVDVIEHYTNMAGHEQTHFFLDAVPVPEENVLVRGKPAFKQQLAALNWERCGSAAYANAIALCAFDQALAYANQREQFGQAIGEFQGLRWKIAEMATQLEASRALTYRAAQTATDDDQFPDRLATSIAKLHSGQAVEFVVSEALQVFGATGYQRDHPLEYLYRLQRSRRIAAGTDEMMKNNVADTVFDDGLPAPG